VIPQVTIDEDIGHLDYETFCELDIRKVGGHRYAKHPSCEVLMASYKLPGMADVVTWLPWCEEPPEDLVEYIENGGKLGAHNASFERNVTAYALSRMHPKFPKVNNNQWVCTAAKAAASGLPRSLDKALKALEAPIEKNTDGTAFIKMFCKPRKPTKKDPRTRIRPRDNWPEFEKGIRYCEDDVRGEEWLHHAIPDLSAREQRFFILDMVMNDRGLPIDIPMVEKALRVVQSLEADIAAEVAKLSGGLRATQVQKMLDMFAKRGLDLENMKKITIENALKDTTLDRTTRRLLELRIEAGKASTKKLVSMLLCADPYEWVVQGGFLYHGAHTGRYAGRLVQPHNFIRGMLKANMREFIFALLGMDDADYMRMLIDGVPFRAKDGFALTSGPIDAISQCMRGFIKAPKGYEFAVVDYTAIEARVLAWLCDEEEMLRAYEAGVDVYKLMAAKLYNIAIEQVSDEQRRIAKNLVLGCGYQLGGAKFVDYAANAGVIITEDFAFKAVRAYRKSVPNIVASWKEVEALCVFAIQNPGMVASGLKCRYYMRKHWLCIQLPSGREIRYPYARVTLVERYGKPHWQISFRTEVKGFFRRETTYGGKLIENIVQAIARDVMMEGMLAAETNGYPVFGTVHDELLTLRKRGTSDIPFLEKLICPKLAWTRGMPLHAKGFICERYEKG